MTTVKLVPLRDLPSEAFRPKLATADLDPATLRELLVTSGPAAAAPAPKPGRAMATTDLDPATLRDVLVSPASAPPKPGRFLPTTDLDPEALRELVVEVTAAPVHGRTRTERTVVAPIMAWDAASEGRPTEEMPRLVRPISESIAESIEEDAPAGPAVRPSRPLAFDSLVDGARLGDAVPRAPIALPLAPPPVESTVRFGVTTRVPHLRAPTATSVAARVDPRRKAFVVGMAVGGVLGAVAALAATLML